MPDEWVGGSSISATLPLLLSVISGVRRGCSPVRRLLFVWAIKNRGKSIIRAKRCSSLTYVHYRRNELGRGRTPGRCQGCARCSLPGHPCSHYTRRRPCSG